VELRNLLYFWRTIVSSVSSIASPLNHQAYVIPHQLSGADSDTAGMQAAKEPGSATGSSGSTFALKNLQPDPRIAVQLKASPQGQTAAQTAPSGGTGGGVIDPARDMDEDYVGLLLNNYHSYFDSAKTGKTDSTITREEVELVANGQAKGDLWTSLSPDEKAVLGKAAQFLIDNPAVFISLDTAHAGGKPDGKISMNDVTDFWIGTEADGNISQAQAYETLKKDFTKFDTAANGDTPDGKVSRADLRAVLYSSTKRVSQEDQEAAAYLLTHRYAFDIVDSATAKGHKTDGIISKNDVDAVNEPGC
jgi:hypothetical protein